MIVPMKKVTVLCLERHRESTLERLRELGLLHVVPVRSAENEPVEQARRGLEHVNAALFILPHHPHRPPSGRSPEQVVEALWAIIHERDTLEDEQDNLQHEVDRLAPFGNFDPDQVRALAHRGLQVKLYQASPKYPPVIPETALRVDCGADKTSVWFAVISRGDAKVEGATEVGLSAKPLGTLRERLAGIAARLAALEEEAAAMGGDYPSVLAMKHGAEDRLHLAEVRSGMGAGPGERIVYLRGYCPERRMSHLHNAAREGGWGVIDEDPAADDPVPTLLENPKWAKPIEPLLNFIGITPGYREIDVSVVFFIFFGLFFAMLVGDAGYGAIFVAASLWARKKNKTAPRHIFTLIEVMGVATMIWGVLTGMYFGVMAKGFLGKATVAWLQNEENIKALCFHIAVAHLSLAHLWNAWVNRKSLAMLAQLGWLGSTWTMYFFANMMVLGKTFPSFMIPVFIVSIVLIVLFMTPVKALKDEWFNHVMLPLNLVSNFVDVVSYIRLFAVGTAGAAVAGSFNSMLTPMFGHWTTGLLAALLLFLAHALNIVLSVMGVLVHGIRLNTLEFSGHIGLQWSGIPFSPFRRKGPPSTEA